LRKAKDISDLTEVKQINIFSRQLEHGELPSSDSLSTRSPDALSATSVGLSAEHANTLITAGFITFALHVEARIASLLGEGFYTIGPCGEELLGCVGLLLRQDDPCALHYRHLAAQVARQLSAGRSIDAILLDRARGFVVSERDPVTGAAHCCIGGSQADYLVTSTLASQTTPAVGRALALSLVHYLGVPCPAPKDAVSFVSVGDGSINNAHFLSGLNLAHYASYNGAKCPVVFAISNNEICISLKGNRYLMKDFVKGIRAPVIVADGTNMLETYEATRRAITTARTTARPVVIIYDNLPRRFGHAATDRQTAYLTGPQIDAAAANNPLLGQFQFILS
jgi:2-oxoisovalerate dehydrogenase E1 component